MSKYDWDKIKLFREAIEGIYAVEKITGEYPKLVLSEKAQKEFERVGKMQEEFYELDIQERLYESGMATRKKDDNGNT